MTNNYGWIIYRVGSNAANQSMCERLPVKIDWDASTAQEAITDLEEEEIYTLYANQRFEAIKTVDFEGSDADFDALQEEVEIRYSGQVALHYDVAPFREAESDKAAFV